MKIQAATPETVTSLWASTEAEVAGAGALEQAAQELAGSLDAHFDESVVLARVYVTVPFGALPEANERFVRGLAEGAGAAGELKATTPVLSLIGTHGEEAGWNDRRSSKGHAGIPLVSASFVGAIPMISRLLRELGLPVEWADTHDLEFIKRMGTGLFFVDNAATAVDHEGRNIIPAQDFVSAHGVKSVFGAGTAYADGRLVVVVVFTRDRLSRDDAERFLTLADLFRDGTAPLAEAGTVFSPN